MCIFEKYVILEENTEKTLNKLTYFYAPLHGMKPVCMANLM